MIEALRGAVSRVFGLVRLRQLADVVRHRLSFVPMIYVAAAVLGAEAVLFLDRTLADRALPDVLMTTVPSARSVFSAMAGGLITSITLLLSMMLVAVQVASTQFSRRSLRGWLGDRTVQHAVGLVLGTTVFCLLALRSTRDVDEGGSAVVPHVTVLVAVALGVASLVAVVRTVDHITNSVRVGSVAERLAGETIEIVDNQARLRETDRDPTAIEAVPGPDADRPGAGPPDGAVVVEAPAAGWVQQIDESALLAALPDDSTGYVVASLGAFVPRHSPLMYVDLGRSDEVDGEQLELPVIAGFALGDTRTMQQDIGFGLEQLVDIAVRALSPGVNDPTTARDVIVQIGEVLLAVWKHEPSEPVQRHDGRTLVRREAAHADYLAMVVGPLCRYGAGDRDVMKTLEKTLLLIRSETVRRELAGPLAPLDDALTEVRAACRVGEDRALNG